MSLTYSPLAPFGAYAGSTSPKILFIGEAWGQTEDELKRPFVGASGAELYAMLGEAMSLAEPELHARGVSMFRYGHAWVKTRDEWAKQVGLGFTNVFNFRPPNNDLETLCVSKTDLPDKGKNYAHHPLVRGKYLRPEFLCELDRLRAEIQECSPNLIVGLGNTALWALLDATNISSVRGTVSSAGPVGNGAKFLATFHPAGVLRKWDWRPIVVADLMKAAREGEFAEIRRPSRRVLISPSIEECIAWTDETLAGDFAMLAPDIETANGQITCIGFARSRSEALVIPFIDRTKANWNYWPTQELELSAWRVVERLLGSGIPKVFQNGLYDLQYLNRMGLVTNNCIEDSMLLHHSIFPELQKGLGFLGSIYSSGEPAWKLMRKRKTDTVKKDE